MKNRIMTVDDLYSFCIQNNFSNFNSDEYGTDIVVSMPATFDIKDNSSDKHLEGLTPFVSRAFHDHVNLNKSDIPEDTFEENLPSAHFRPILANIIVDENGNKDFNSHDFHTEEDNDGNERIVYDEQPVGVIDGTKTEIEYDEEQEVNRAVLRGYLYNGYCQDVIDILNRRKQTSCSVELCVRKFSFNAKDKVLTIEDFYVSGLTLLGESVKPGMKNSRLELEDFSSKNYDLSFNDNTNKFLVQTLERINVMLSSLDKSHFENNTTRKEEELAMTKIENMEVTEELEVTNEVTEEVTETTANEEVTEVESTDNADETPDVVVESEEVKTEENVESVITEETESEETVEMEVKNSKFTKSFEISHEDIRYALYGLLTSYEEADNEWYFIENVYDTYFVYSGWCNEKTYGQAYTKDGDNISFVDERYELFKELLTASEKAELESMRANYSSIQNELNTYKAAELYADKMSVFEDEAYSEYLNTDEFKSLMSKESVDSMTKEELHDKAEITFAKLIRNNKVFALTSEKKPEPKTVSVAFANVGTPDNFLDGLLKK